MNHAGKIARQDALTEALREIDRVIGDRLPTDQAFKIIEALKRLRDQDPGRLSSLIPVDYLAMVQERARAAWVAGHGEAGSSAIATPLGFLTATVWRITWKGKKRGVRIAWRAEYSLDQKPITLREIKAAGLAQRPTTRIRKRKQP